MLVIHILCICNWTPLTLVWFSRYLIIYLFVFLSGNQGFSHSPSFTRRYTNSSRLPFPPIFYLPPLSLHPQSLPCFPPFLSFLSPWPSLPHALLTFLPQVRKGRSNFHPGDYTCLFILSQVQISCRILVARPIYNGIGSHLPALVIAAILARLSGFSLLLFV